MDKHDIRYLNAFFKSNYDLKVFLEKSQKIVLPPVKQKGITTNYLLKVARDEVFTIPQDTHKHFTGTLSKSVTKLELHAHLKELIGDKVTGFADDALPSKSWLLDCIYTQNQAHPIF